MDVIRVSHLTKHFKDITAVDDLSFSVPAGKIYGFLGQNGAGKSTTIRMLLTLVEPSNGSIEIFGEKLDQKRNAILKKVGAIIEKPDVYKYLTAEENLRLFARMSGVKVPEERLHSMLQRVGLADRKKSKVKTFSQGMKQRLGIAVALIHDPELIILDEPINGLDPQGIADMRNLILSLSKEHNKTVFISSHLLSEIELIADSMLIIDRGKKKAEGRVNELFDPKETVVQLKAVNLQDAENKIRSSTWHTKVTSYNRAEILFQLNKNEVPALARDLVSMNIEVLSLHARYSLEDFFISLTSRNQYVGTVQN